MSVDPELPKRVVLSFDIGIKNFAYCMLDENENIIQWNVADISGSTYDRQCQKLIQALDAINSEEMTDLAELEVIIEKQPGVNPKMRIISGQVQMYYSLLKYRNLFKINKVIYYSARNKLKCYEPKEGDEPIPEKKYSTKYATRKYLSKQHCERILVQNNQDEWLKVFSSSKKKDDLSDSFLQGVAYLRGFK